MTTTKEQMVGKILVVDDEIELKNGLVDALSKQSYDARGYTSGHEALEALRAEDFDLLISDLMMPEMDGIVLIKAALEIDPHLVAIIMTGQGTIQTAVDAMKAGTFDYVLKPFRLQTLMPVLTRAINTRRLRKENLQLRETVTIYELAQTIAFTLDPQTLISKLADAALQQTEADEVSILLPVNDGGELYVAAVRGENRQRLLGERVPVGDTISGWVARERTPLLLHGEINDERFRTLWPHPEIRSAVSVPMQVANKLVGIINLNVLKRPRALNLGQMKALTILASTAAAALESASLYTQVRDAEEKYRSIFDNAIEGLFQSTPEGRFLTVNPAFARILGYTSPEEVISCITDIGRQVYVDPQDRVAAALLQKEPGFIQGLEIQAYRKDGEKIWLSVNRRSVRNKDGEEIYIEGSVEEITERKRIEEALIESEGRKAAILKSALDCVITIDHEGKILDFNPAAEHTFGYQSEDVVGKHMAEMIIPPQLRSHHEAGLARYLETGCSSMLGKRIEISGMRADGAEIPVELTVTAIGEVPKPTFTAFIRDLTERKDAEAALRETVRSKEESLALLDTLLSTAPIGFAFLTPGLVYQRINESLASTNGLSVDEHLGHTLTEVLPQMANVLEPIMRRALNTGEPVLDVELSGETPADPGRQHHWLASFYPVRMQAGEILGVGVLVSEITDRKQLEDQLRQSQKMEAVGQLAGGIAHDFNNLLTAITGYSSLGLQHIEGNQRIKVYLEEIKKAGDRAANLTRQLLAFGRKQILQPLPLNLNDIVSDINKLLQRLIGEDIQLSAKLGIELRRIKVDPGQIEQVLVNLAVNARDAMPRGGKLTIETANVELSQEYAGRHVGVQPGRYVMLAVSDNGMGMDEKTQERIYEPFFTTKAKDKGTGLGLSTVYGIVKQSGGHISVYSEIRHGTTFKIYLPEHDAPEMTGPAAVEGAIPRGSETILLVEDEDVVRGLARQILEQAGYSVLEASRGEEALRLCAAHKQPIQLVLTDVVMPETSGKEVADRLRVLRPEIKVLFMSGYADEAIVHHGVLDAKVEFIQKPFTPVALARKVREVIDSNGNHGIQH
jgi:two-component system, cell cycle sensor histidine kinase and response regulator CckA